MTWLLTTYLMIGHFYIITWYLTGCLDLKSDEDKLQVYFLGFLNNVNYKYYIFHSAYNYSIATWCLPINYLVILFVHCWYLFHEVHSTELRTYILIREILHDISITLYLFTLTWWKKGTKYQETFLLKYCNCCNYPPTPLSHNGHKEGEISLNYFF